MASKLPSKDTQAEHFLDLLDEVDRLKTNSATRKSVAEIGLSLVVLFFVVRFLQLALDVGMVVEAGLALLAGGGIIGGIQLWKKYRIRKLHRHSVQVTMKLWNSDRTTVDAWRTHLPSDAPEAPRCAEFEFRLRLPFVPPVGLCLDKDCWSSGPLATVTWRDADSVFECATSDLFAESPAEHDVMVRQALNSGWTRVGGDAPGWVRGIVASG